MQKEEEVPGRGVKRAREQGDKQGILSGPIGQERKERIPCHERDAVCGISILTGKTLASWWDMRRGTCGAASERSIGVGPRYCIVPE